jgi:cytochrome P450
MRAQRILYDERRAAWLVFRYADVEQVLLEVDSFSSQRTLKPDGSVDEVAGAGMLGTDPPRHRHLRSLVVQAFTQKRVARLEARVGLGQLMARFPRAQRDRSWPLELRQSSFVYSLKSYPIFPQG